MTFREIKPGIYWIGSIDWDRRLFDSLIPLPQGTSYNAYLVKGSEKTALIDTVDPTKEYELVQNLVRIGVDGIDYIIVNHAEQDHSGALPMILGSFRGPGSSPTRSAATCSSPSSISMVTGWMSSRTTTHSRLATRRSSS